MHIIYSLARVLLHKDMENHVKDKEQGCMSPYFSWLAYLLMDYNAIAIYNPYNCAHLMVC